VTLELLGVASVEPEQVERDAAGLLQMLTRCGALAGDAPAMAAMTTPTQFEGVKFVRAPHAGIVVYHAELGDRIEAG
jgi:predicted deacylase